MHARLKMMTVLVTMVAMFAMLPALSAVAAEPLDDGTYAVTVADATYELRVVDGTPYVAPDSGVEWFFSYNDAREVLDEFSVVVNGQAYEVEIGEDGKAYAKLSDGDDLPAETVVPLADDEEPQELSVEAAEEPQADEGEDGTEDETEDAGHGELVSAVAQCAPNGREAREAGLPNHGAIVSAVAKGLEEDLRFTVPTVDSETGTEVVITAGMSADEICAVLEEALATGTAAAEAAAEGETEDTKGKPAKAEKADGEAPGKSGEARGKGKKNAED